MDCVKSEPTNNKIILERKTTSRFTGQDSFQQWFLGCHSMTTTKPSLFIVSVEHKELFLFSQKGETKRNFAKKFAKVVNFTKNVLQKFSHQIKRKR
jgi:hypothetical protein